MKLLMLGMLALIPAILHGSFPAPGKKTLSGRITDSKTGEPLPGVTLYIPDLKKGADSNLDGTYRIDDLPSTKILLQVTFIGYKLIAENIDLNTTSIKDFALEEAVNELNEVVVTGLSKAAERNRTPTPVTLITPVQLLQNSSTNIIDALATQPGISQVTTGSGISKPVIRGLGYNRVVTVNDGIRQEGQQWGEEHGIEIDEYGVNKVEILKGPASLAYGSDAMGGVINMISSPTLAEGKVTGSVLANYQTNNGLYGFSGNVAGNMKGVIWDVRYSNKAAHSYENKFDGYVFNSGFKENGISGIIGLNKSWGYSHLHVSSYNMTPGIIEGERDSTNGNFIRYVALNDTTQGYVGADESDYTSYTPSIPFQKINHNKFVLNNSIIIRNSTLKVTAGWQQNKRREYSDPLGPDQPGLYLLLNTINYDLRYLLPESSDFNISFGLNGMKQSSENKGTEFLIPDYDLFDIGIFALAKKTFGNLDISGGIRFDTRDEKGQDLYLNANGEPVGSMNVPHTQRFKSFHSTFDGVSGSIGATYQFSELVFTKLNLSHGFRAPNITELSANGVHEGSINYIIGDPTLQSEKCSEIDYSIGINSHHVTIEVDLFDNRIDNYIFQRKLQGQGGGDSISDGYSTFKYSSGNANLFGGEIYVDIHPHPLDWLHFENSFSYVQSVQIDQPDSMKYLPMTPAPHLNSEIKITRKKLWKFLSNAYLKIEWDTYFTQDKYYRAFGTETETPGYSLINFGMGADVTSGSNTLFSVFINVNNLADVAYQSHLSRLKYLEVNQTTGRGGVYNMGRNFSFKIIIPIDIKGKT